MNLASTFKYGVVAAVAAFAATPAMATTLDTFANGTASIGITGTITGNTSDINTSTIFSLSSAGAFYTSGGTGDFSVPSSGGLDSIFATDINVTTGASGQFDINDGSAGGANPTGRGLIGEFYSTTNWIALSNGGGNNSTVSYYISGFLNPPTSGNATFVNSSPASITVSLTQTGGAGKSISFSATLAAPPAPITTSVPEPASLALLGVGILGLGMVTRRKV